MPADSTVDTAKPKSAPPDSNVKETIESILVAFILAFIFRAFIVEAFVIPTGSMAPTLLGAHMRFQCPDCGYRWDVNFQPADEDNIPSASPVAPWGQPVCPNCGYTIDSTDRAFPVQYGDRILVLKYAYLLQPPQRWDVVVFKSPHDNQTATPQTAPQPRFAQNYIKRLVGRPGERIMIVDGDVYVGEKNDPRENFKIQRKPRVVQNALWRNVYDNDFIPHGLTRTAHAWKQPWQTPPGSGWKLNDNSQAARVFEFNNPSGAGVVSFHREVNPETFTLTDWLAYDQIGEEQSLRTKVPVSDLQVSCDYERTNGDGPLALTLTKGDDTFVAEITPGHARLVWTDGQGNIKTYSPASVRDLLGTGPVRVEFANVDYQVTLCVNGHQIISTEDAYQPNLPKLLEQAAEGTQAKLATVQIAADHQQCRLSHLKLSRDIHYLNGAGYSSFALASPDSIVDLGPEYFVLGDNSLISGDARTWVSSTDDVVLPDEDLFVSHGRVPGRFMLGKAFFVYWPAGYRLWPGASFGIVPNFGDMRFIH